ncbi:7393_t:CDS:2 [Entrophospora sp. SA101]|nr:19987_t:CDS:2 [Entrophospora sp. SA101]CAJ0911342.1 7393_t:CDS:2 [Entrophospora sp. SA101]
MHECEIWKDVSEKEFENAKEGMEKLLMMRLYKLIFTPAIKGQAVTDDLERDEILHQKIQIFRWVGEKHLDIPITPHNEIFLNHAKNELLKMRQFIAPRDKLICILNCCKVIYGLIKFVDGEEGADKFLPILIFVILKANPEHLMSNVQFRNPEKLQSEAGYYLSSLMSAVAFIENMDVNSLTITQDEFDSNIELTVKELAEETPKLPENTKEISYDNAINPSKPIVANNNNNRLSLINPAQLLNPAQAKALFEKGSYYAQRTIQTPINMVGKLFSEINTGLKLKRQRELEEEDNNLVDELIARSTEKEMKESLKLLKSIFSDLEPELCEEVYYAKDYNMNSAANQLLEISNSSIIIENEYGNDDAVHFIGMNHEPLNHA